MPENATNGQAKKSSFWKTLPGLITAVATLVTALTGAYLVMQPDNGDPDPPDPNPVIEFRVQASYTQDCKNRPEGTICVSYADGFVWLIKEAVQGRSTAGEYKGNTIAVVHGQNSDYHHVLNTKLVKWVRK